MEFNLGDKVLVKGQLAVVTCRIDNEESKNEVEVCFFDSGKLAWVLRSDCTPSSFGGP